MSQCQPAWIDLFDVICYALFHGHGDHPLDAYFSGVRFNVSVKLRKLQTYRRKGAPFCDDNKEKAKAERRGMHVDPNCLCGLYSTCIGHAL